MMWMIFVNPTHNISCGDERPGVQRNLCERNDGDENTHDHGERLGIARHSKNVGCDSLLDAIPKHENANDSQTGVEDVLHRVHGLVSDFSSHFHRKSFGMLILGRTVQKMKMLC